MKSTIEHEPIIHNGQEYEPVAFRAPKPGEWFVRNQRTRVATCIGLRESQ